MRICRLVYVSVVVLGRGVWNGAGEVRLGSVFTDVTPRKHARARICDQNDTHFASVRAACTSKPEISTGVRFKVVPTFSELTIKACGSIIAGKTCSSSFQVFFFNGVRQYYR